MGVFGSYLIASVFSFTQLKVKVGEEMLILKEKYEIVVLVDVLKN